MTIKQKAYKFRLYPNKEQEIMFVKTFGSSRTKSLLKNWKR